MEVVGRGGRDSCERERIVRKESQETESGLIWRRKRQLIVKGLVKIVGRDSQETEAGFSWNQETVVKG